MLRGSYKFGDYTPYLYKTEDYGKTEINNKWNKTNLL